MVDSSETTNTVLFVDDEKRVLNTLKRLLLGEPFNVLTAESAAAALKILNTTPVDIIISDERMPGMRGSDLLTEVKRLYPDICRIMLTGHASLEASINAINSGRIFRFLLKPVTKVDLLEALYQGIDELVQYNRLLRLSQQAGSVCSFEVQIDPKGRQIFTRWSDNARGMLALDNTQPLDNLEILFNKVHPDDVATARRGCLFCMDHNQCPSAEYRIILPDGQYRWILQTSDVSMEASGKTLRLLSVLSDITERKIQQEQLEYQAYHDDLTGLGNRARLLEILSEKLSKESDARQQLALLFIDLDNFKLVNDSLGHSFGDLLLQNYARRLTTLMPVNTEAIRLGGDEFAIVVQNINGEVITLADKIQKAMEQPFKIGEIEIFVSNSIGIAFNHNSNDSALRMIREADTAMYEAKSHGKNSIHFFDEKMHDKATRHFKMTSDIRKGLSNNEFYLLFQPIVNISTLLVEGFEALLRWEHPEEGLIMPDSFIPVAEESGLIIPLGNKVVEMACAQAKEWEAVKSSITPFISFNVSVHQLRQIDFATRVTDTIKAYDIDPYLLKVEITESGVMDDAETSLRLLHALRKEKLRLQIDDFGTGYSSLSYLRRIPADNLKIDRSFVDGMENDEEKLAIVKTIITLADSLGMDVVAEGIETVEQLKQLRKLGCKYGQGFLFNKPMSKDKALLKNNYKDILK
ncbi:EAL domain-containing protein [Maridesulfovibrio sp.]|uniref:putative bifunctional diguanylate cyclase/phosphodiesterase n=1 Tax=Maridesulfovibrio sp. TaxID=2795000 RepID=UPI0029F507BC|nr:EAL domain-containing protein [Maridesulfovibrio sp.]